VADCHENRHKRSICENPNEGRAGVIGSRPKDITLRDRNVSKTEIDAKTGWMPVHIVIEGNVWMCPSECPVVCLD